MNTTDYFTNINALFLFCIFTCGLLVWAVISRQINVWKLQDEQEAHLKATLINTKLNKSLEDEKKVSDNMEKLLRQVETEVRDLQAKLDHADADRIELRAERATLENKLTDALAKVRKRDKDGKFLPSGNARVRTPKKLKLVHGLTVKNPTEDEAKMIFDEARRLKIKVSKDDAGVPCPNIWVFHKKICVCVEHVVDYEWVTVVTAKEFVQRMRNGRG